MNILGISALYHDSAAALVQDGTIVAAAQEERFTRKKNDADFPRRAIAYCLHAGCVPRDGIDAVVYYDKPLTTFSRLLRTYLKVGIHGARSFNQAMPVWFRQKLWIPVLIERELRELRFLMPKQLWFTEHHESDAASAFFASSFNSAAILTFDGVGEWATSSIGVGRGNRLELQEQIYFPDSIGLLYSAFTHFCGFRVNSRRVQVNGSCSVWRTHRMFPDLREPHRCQGRWILQAKFGFFLFPWRSDNDKSAVRRVIWRSPKKTGSRLHSTRASIWLAPFRSSPRMFSFESLGMQLQSLAKRMPASRAVSH